jgi:hypothetical protein
MFECIYQQLTSNPPLLSHCNDFAVHIHLYIFNSLYTMIPFPTRYSITLFFPLPLIHSNFVPTHPYFSHLYITPHSAFHILCLLWLYGAQWSPSLVFKIIHVLIQYLYFPQTNININLIL